LNHKWKSTLKHKTQHSNHSKTLIYNYSGITERQSKVLRHSPMSHYNKICVNLHKPTLAPTEISSNDFQLMYSVLHAPLYFLSTNIQLNTSNDITSKTIKGYITQPSKTPFQRVFFLIKPSTNVIINNNCAICTSAGCQTRYNFKVFIIFVSNLKLADHSPKRCICFSLFIITSNV
jgi:hypothetical protein